MCALCLTAAAPLAPAQDGPREVAINAPYVKTPHDLVAAMLRLAGVGAADVVYDLGCGDGRIVIAAARHFGARGVCVDLDPERIAEARGNARRAGVARRLQFRIEDLFDADISQATVVTLYLLPDLNLKLRPKLLRELKPGARVVSHSFPMGDWKPDQEIGLRGSKLYRWVVPAGAPPARYSPPAASFSMPIWESR